MSKLKQTAYFGFCVSQGPLTSCFSVIVLYYFLKIRNYPPVIKFPFFICFYFAIYSFLFCKLEKSIPSKLADINALR